MGEHQLSETRLTADHIKCHFSASFRVFRGQNDAVIFRPEYSSEALARFHLPELTRDSLPLRAGEKIVLP